MKVLKVLVRVRKQWTLFLMGLVIGYTISCMINVGREVKKMHYIYYKGMMIYTGDDVQKVLPQIRILNYTTDSEVNKKFKIVKNRLIEEEDQSHMEPSNIPRWYDVQKIRASQNLENKPHKLLIIFQATNCQGDKDSQLFQATWANNIHMVLFVPQDCTMMRSTDTIIRVPFHQLNSLYIIKYIQEKYLYKFSWFLIIQNDTYVHIKYIKNFIEDLEAESVKLYYFGKPTHFMMRTRNYYQLQIKDSYCSESAGVLINHQLVHSLSTNINTCIYEYQNSDFVKTTEKLGLCVKKQLNICCSGVPTNTKGIQSFYDQQYIWDIQMLWLKPFYQELFTIHPITTNQLMYTLHYFYKYLEYEETKERLLYLSGAISLLCDNVPPSNFINGEKTGLCGDRDVYKSIAKDGTSTEYTPLSQYDIQSWVYFDSRVFYQDETIIPRKQLGSYNYYKQELESALQEAVRLANLNYPSLVFYRLVNGYVRHNGLKGNEYIMDVELNDSNNPNIIVQRRFSLLKPLSSWYSLQYSKAIGGETVNIVVPISGMIDRVKQFFRMYEKISLMQDEKTRLILVVYGEEVLVYCKNQVKYYADRYPHAQFTIISNKGKFTRARALNTGMSMLHDNDLAFLCDIDIEIREGSLDRCRRNTIANQQVYYPEVFKWYNMDYVYKLKTRRPHQYIARDMGHWGYYGYGMVCIYKRDFVESGGLNTDIVGWGGEDTEYYNRIIHKFKVFRAPDPGLVHQWHDKNCHHLHGNQRRDCYFSKSETLADKRELASYIFKLEEDGQAN